MAAGGPLRSHPGSGLGAARGPRPRRRDAAVLARRGRADPRGSARGRGAVRADRDRRDSGSPASSAIGPCPSASCSTGSTTAWTAGRSELQAPHGRRTGRGWGRTRRRGEMTVAAIADRQIVGAHRRARPATRGAARPSRRGLSGPCSSSTRSPSASLAGLAIGGRLGGLATLRFRWAWLAVARARAPGRALLRAARVAGRRRRSGAVRGFEPARCWPRSCATWRCPACRSIAVGAGCNLVAIVANGGSMPADPAALAVGRHRHRGADEQRRDRRTGPAPADGHLRDARLAAVRERVQHRRRADRGRRRGDDRARDADAAAGPRSDATR